MSDTALATASHLRISVAASCAVRGVIATCNRHNVSRKFVRYWDRKFSDPHFHPDDPGGAGRNNKFGLNDAFIIDLFIGEFILANPQATGVSISREIVIFQWHVCVFICDCS